MSYRLCINRDEIALMFSSHIDSWSWSRDVDIAKSTKLDFASSLSLLFVFAISFAFIYLSFNLQSLHHIAAMSLSSWRWAVVRNSESQERISDTIQRVLEFSSRRNFHTRSIVIVRSCFRWRRDKSFFTSIHEADFF